MSVSFRRWSAVAAFAICCAFIGCSAGSKDAPAYQTVHGRVTLDGAPLAKARVTFIPNNGPASGAVTDEDGKYDLLNRDGGKGAVAGTHKVEVSTDLNGEHTKQAEKVPAKYNEQTTLSTTVDKGDNERNFELTSK